LYFSPIFGILDVRIQDPRMKRKQPAQTFGKIDSKFRFVILASKRAKQLLKGSKPKLKSKSKSLIRLAQQEIKDGLINYEILKSKKEEAVEPEERVFSGAELGEETEETGEEIKEESELEEEVPEEEPGEELGEEDEEK